MHFSGLDGMEPVVARAAYICGRGTPDTSLADGRMACMF